MTSWKPRRASPRKLRELEGQRAEYTACVRVLGDLAQLRWRLVKSGHGLELHSPRPQDRRRSVPCEMQRRKEAVRRELRPRLRRQFADSNVRKFIDRLERPGPSSRHRSIRTLIADGAELQQRLLMARGHHVDDPARVDALRQAVRPYLQLVEPRTRDAETGIALRDIWRYFRYTWSIPQTPIPGAQSALPCPRRGARTPCGDRHRRTRQLRCADGSSRPRDRLERIGADRCPDRSL